MKAHETDYVWLAGWLEAGGRMKLEITANRKTTPRKIYEYRYARPRITLSDHEEEKIDTLVALSAGIKSPTLGQYK